MSSNDSTINLDDSSVLSSTKNSSVLEVTNMTDSVIDVSDDSSDTEGGDEDLTVNSTSENIDSSSDRLIRENSKELSTAEFNSDEEMNSDHYVTSVQSQSQMTKSRSQMSGVSGDSLASPDQSSILSATQLMSDISSNSVNIHFSPLSSSCPGLDPLSWSNS